MNGSELNLLYQVQHSSPPCPIELPNYDPAYCIDLNTREVETPKDVVVTKDHNSTTFYFIVDRFFDYIDLSTVGCVVLYTIDKKTYAYPIPFYDIYTLSYCNKMIMPWSLSEVVTQQEGEVEFSFKFYKLKGDLPKNSEMIYSLNTKTAKFSVQRGLDAPELELDDLVALEQYSCLYDLIDNVRALRDSKFCWTVYNDELI